MPLSILIELATVNSNSLAGMMGNSCIFCKEFSKFLGEILELRKEDLQRTDIKYPLFLGYVLYIYLLWYVPVVLTLF